MKDRSTMMRAARDMLRTLLAIVVIVAARGQASAAQSPAPASPDQVPVTTLFSHAESTRWWLSGQINLIEQAHGSFPATYTGHNSFLPRHERTVSRVLTLYTGLRLGHGWEAFLDVESAGGRGLSDAFGLAGFTDLDVVRNPTLGTTPSLARLPARKSIAPSPHSLAAPPPPPPLP